ncbi:MAG: polysaccharide deacetylase family protein [Sphingobacteriales bacterium]|nr:polysaccharide deacetylase family protein [Sphingobacteriales bacterium]
MIVFSSTISLRLQYILDFAKNQIGSSTLTLTDNIDEFKSYDGVKINYSERRIDENELWIKPHLLLFENTIKDQQISCFTENDQKAFFKTDGDCPFDIFAASFYLLSRYEEYLSHKKDMYGRYAHENSLAFREGFLHLPLINIWINSFKEVLRKKFPNSTFPNSQFHFLPTYDIDEMFCYLHKPWWKTKGGNIRSRLKNENWEVKERQEVLDGLLPDPYDSFDRIKFLHTIYHQLQGIVFILVAKKNSKYDKNISPYKVEFKEKIRSFFDTMPEWDKNPHPDLKAGLHPSWQSGDDPSLIKKELDILESEIGVESLGSRQHYIRFTLPQTFRQLIDAGIYDDYSMGYGSINGFRASVTSEFYWYDLEAEKQTELKMHPFCFMDANSYYEQKNTSQQALDEMMNYFEIIKSVGGTMITIWHNTFLGTHRRFAGWREVYEEFIRRIYFQIPYVNQQIDNEGMDKRHFLS